MKWNTQHTPRMETISPLRLNGYELVWHTVCHTHGISIDSPLLAFELNHRHYHWGENPMKDTATEARIRRWKFHPTCIKIELLPASLPMCGRRWHGWRMGSTQISTTEMTQVHDFPLRRHKTLTNIKSYSMPFGSPEFFGRERGPICSRVACTQIQWNWWIIS